MEASILAEPAILVSIRDAVEGRQLFWREVATGVDVSHEHSRFGEQVSDYADLHTSKVSNFLSYSPLRYFRAPRRTMPHES